IFLLPIVPRYTSCVERSDKRKEMERTWQDSNNLLGSPLSALSTYAQKLDWSQSVLDGNYLRITVEILLRICSQSTQRIRSRAQKLLLISSPTQFAMFQRQELTLSLNRVIAIEFPNCDPAPSKATEMRYLFYY
ncbi:hypothetical protein ALC57_11480, partial [Trachymyrmex cornetzi]